MSSPLSSFSSSQLDVAELHLTLANFTTDLLGLILSFVDSQCIGRIALIGNYRLNKKLAQPYVVKSLEIEIPAGDTNWPSLVSFFPHLHRLTVQCAANASYIALKGVDIESISKDVREMRLSFGNDWISFFDQDPYCTDIAYFDPNNLHLKDLSSLFPHLERFEFLATVTHSELFPTWPSSLPSTLQTIKFSHWYAFSDVMVSELPNSLEDLEITLSSWAQSSGQFDGNKEARNSLETSSSSSSSSSSSNRIWPQHLRRLSLNAVTHISLLASLPVTLTDLTLIGLDSENLFGMSPHWRHLGRLASLARLETFIAKFDLPLALTLRSLSRLETLIMSFDDMDVPQLGKLPRGIKRLTLSSQLETLKSLFGSPQSLFEWTYLPPHLEYLEPQTLLMEVTQDPRFWHLAPKSLKNWSFSTDSLTHGELLTYAPDIPPSLTQLHVKDLIGYDDFWAQDHRSSSHKSLASLHLHLRYFSESHIFFLAHCSSLISLEIYEVTKMPLDSIWDVLPPSLTSLTLPFPGQVSTLQLSQRPWTRQLTHLSLCLLTNDLIDDFYHTLPPSLLKLEIHSVASTISCKNFSGLPRQLQFLSIRYLRDAVDDECLLSLPPSLRVCHLLSAITTNYSTQTLLRLPMSLESLVLPRSQLKETQLLPFVLQRPYIQFRAGLSAPSYSEDVLRRYLKENLTMGDVEPRYR